MVYQIALSSFSIFAIVPTPSTWPETIWPPNRPLAAIALSKFTLLPVFRLFKDERLKVSCITSALKNWLSISVTVKQIPFTAMLSPIFVSSKTFVAPIVNIAELADFFMLLTVPISSIIPVNISLTPLCNFQLKYLHQECWPYFFQDLNFRLAT